MRSILSKPVPFLLVAVLACARSDEKGTSDTAATTPPPPPPSAAPAMASITDREWVLTGVGERTNPMGQDNRPPTLRLESGTSRAAGFAGCNRFSGPYTLSGDSLSFGPLVSTKMACAQGTDVEVSYLAALARVSTYTSSDTSLTLLAERAPLATFGAR